METAKEMIDKAIGDLETIRIDINLKPNREGIDDKASDLNLLLYQIRDCLSEPEVGEKAVVEKLENMLEDVVNELDLSNGIMEEYGPKGSAPAELVRLVLEQKDQQIRMLKAGMKPILQPHPISESRIEEPGSCPKEYNEDICDGCKFREYEMVSHPGGESTASVEKAKCELGHWEDDF